MRWLLVASLVVTVASTASAVPAPAQAPRRGAPVVEASPERAPSPRQNAPSICCCRVFVQRWTYAWMSPQQCSSSSGTCVEPDHC